MASPSESKKVKFLLRIEEDVLQEIRGLAKEGSVSVSELVRNVLKAYVEKVTSEPSPPKQETKWWL
tara:strand:+ start:325 stop:522 length:198 start_codon:yes stop_codon:yes gene_type:complete